MTYIQQIEKITGLTGVKIVPYHSQVHVYNDKGLAVTQKKTTSRLQIVVGDKEIAHFHLCQVPGCCGMCMSFHTSVAGTYLNKGLGRVLMKLKEQIAFNAGYTLMLATDATRNVAQMKIFDGAKWTRKDLFTNKRTRNEVGVYTRHLADTGIQIGQETPVIQGVP